MKQKYFLLVNQVSLIVLAWLLVLRVLPSDGLSWGFFIFFCVLALLSSLNYPGGKQ